MRGRPSRGGCWALLPAKSLYSAKSRLAHVLAPTERAELARAMLEDVLESLSAVKEIAGIVVVSNDETLRVIARSHGSRLLDEPIEGLNAAVWHGMRWLSIHRAAAVLVTPGDIPFASTHEFAAIKAAVDDCAAVLVPANRDGGTNMLGLALPSRFEPQFGADSFVRHQQEARRVGLASVTVQLAGVGHDIDVPADLYINSPGNTGQKTLAFLDRLAAADTLPTGAPPPQ